MNESEARAILDGCAWCRPHGRPICSFCRKALADYMALPPGMTLLDLVNRDLLRMELLGVLRDRMLRLRG
jgi:hypothetical protein